MAARLLEASAAAVVARRPRLSADRRRARRLHARAALGRRLHVCRLAARPRHRRRLPGADRGAGARRHPLLQFLGAEVRARPDAAAVLGDDRAVSLSGARKRPREALAARRRLARAVLLVEIRGLRARGQHRPVHAVRSQGPREPAHARAMAHGACLPRGDRAQRELAGRDRLHADALCRCARQDRDALVPRVHISAAMDREPALLHRAGDRPHRARAHRRAAAAGGRRRDDVASRAAISRCWRSGRSWSPRRVALVAGRLPGRDVGLSALVVRAARRDRVVRAGDRQRAGAALRGRLRRRVSRDAARLRGGRGARARLARPAQGDTVSRPAVGR